MASLLALEVASMLLVMWAVAPVGWMSQYLTRGPVSAQQPVMTPRSSDRAKIAELSADRGSAPYRDAQPTSASDSLPCARAQGASTRQVILQTQFSGIRHVTGTE